MSEEPRAKPLLRASMRARLAEVDAIAARTAGERMVEHVGARAVWREAAIVAMYKAIPGELDADALARRAWSEGKVVLLPAVVDGGLVFRRWREGDALVRGGLGVREPSLEWPAVPIEEASLVFVPGLAFDRRGGRLGRGAGYYDRALAGLGASAGSTPVVGLGFALQLVDDVPMTPLDVRLDAVVTDEGWIDCA